VFLLVRTIRGGWEAARDALLRPRVFELAASSLALTLAVVLSCAVVGIGTAWLITRSDVPGRRLWTVLAALPLAIPSYVAAFGWVATVPGLSGFSGAWLVLTTVSAPYVTLPVAAALRAADPDVEAVARTLGRGPVTAFWSATWPQVRTSAAAGSLLVALYVLSDFGAVALLRFDALTWAISSAYGASFDRTLAAVLALVLVALAGLVMLAERRMRTRAESRLPTIHAPGRIVVVPLRRARPIAVTALALVAAVSLGVPLAALARRLAEGTAIGLHWPELVSATSATVGLALAGAVVALALALPVGILAARYRGALQSTLESASYLAHALPGIVVGLSLVFFTLAVAPRLYQSWVVLAFAYGVLFLPKAVGSVRAAVAQVPTGLEDVARTLGTGVRGVWLRVTAPLAWPGVMAGTLLVALTAMKELPATLLLRPTGVDTLATELWGRTTIAAYGSAAPYAVALVVLAAVPTFLLSGAASAGRDSASPAGQASALGAAG